MVEHLVFFKLKDGITNEEKQELMSALRAMPPQIPEIKHLACGEDFGGRSRGFEIGLVIRFENREGLNIYQPHPVHQAFVANNKDKWTEVMALDFQTD